MTNKSFDVLFCFAVLGMILAWELTKKDGIYWFLWFSVLFVEAFFMIILKLVFCFS